MVGTKSSATVQQMQPLASSMMSSSAHASRPQPLSRLPSTPTSPNSLTMSAMRRPVGLGQQVADDRRLAGAEEAGDDGCGNLAHQWASCAPVWRVRRNPRLTQSTIQNTAETAMALAAKALASPAGTALSPLAWARRSGGAGR
jgi:hypothetical protein